MPSSPPTTRPRWLRLAPCAAAVLAVHLAAWHEVAGSMGRQAPVTAAPQAMEVRTVVPVETPAIGRAAVSPERPAAKPARPAAKPRAVPQAMAPATPPPPLPEAAAADTDSLDGLQLAAATATAAATPAASEPALDTDPTGVPTYRTRLPASTVLTYDLRRGYISGTGKLDWRVANGQYRAQLEGRVAGLQILVQNSEGGIDANGIAPVRFTDERRKGVQAANFRRDTQRITYSGPSTEYPLAPGTQDRLSWMLQLPAIVAANPARWGVGGARISMFVSGARGDADVWTFQVRAVEDLPPGEGNAAAAIKLVREPRKPHDTLVEVWLDPKRQYLPARARLSSGGDVLELVLLRTASPA